MEDQGEIEEEEEEEEERSKGGSTIVFKPASTNDPALSTIGNTEIKNAMYPWVV